MASIAYISINTKKHTIHIGANLSVIDNFNNKLMKMSHTYSLVQFKETSPRTADKRPRATLNGSLQMTRQ